MKRRGFIMLGAALALFVIIGLVGFSDLLPGYFDDRMREQFGVSPPN